MRLRMVNTNILVRPIKEVEGEIIVPDEPGIGDAIRGEVKEIGDGRIHSGMEVPMRVRPSSIVWFDPREARLLKVQEEDWYVIRQETLLAIEEDK